SRAWGSRPRRWRWRGRTRSWCGCFRGGFIWDPFYELRRIPGIGDGPSGGRRRGSGRPRRLVSRVRAVRGAGARGVGGRRPVVRRAGTPGGPAAIPNEPPSASGRPYPTPTGPSRGGGHSCGERDRPPAPAGEGGTGGALGLRVRRDVGGALRAARGGRRGARGAGDPERGGSGGLGRGGVRHRGGRRVPAGAGPGRDPPGRA